MQNSILNLELNSITITKGESTKIANVNYVIVDNYDKAPDRVVARLSIPIDTSQDAETYDMKIYIEQSERDHPR